MADAVMLSMTEEGLVEESKRVSASETLRLLGLNWETMTDKWIEEFTGLCEPTHSCLQIWQGRFRILLELKDRLEMTSGDIPVIEEAESLLDVTQHEMLWGRIRMMAYGESSFNNLLEHWGYMRALGESTGWFTGPS